MLFNGDNSGPQAQQIYRDWLKRHAGSDRITGSKTADTRAALVEHFRDQGTMMIATEAGGEGINLQFCSLVINYDLPWNPQRIEQRIGRCHRYGQKHDVVVVNFVDRSNEADARVYELLAQKFELFDGVFGASDEVLGAIGSGVDFERRIAAIYDNCRTSEQIDAAFAQLREELEASINSRMRETEAKLVDTFDAQILDRLRLQHKRAEQQLDRTSRLFWRLSHFVLADCAQFDDQRLAFQLSKPPCASAPTGSYQLVRKGQALPQEGHVYRLTHPLGEYVLDSGRRLDAPLAELRFDLSASEHKISVLQNLSSAAGWLELNLLELESFQLEEHLVFTACTDDGHWLDAEACALMLGLAASVGQPPDRQLPTDFPANVKRQLEASLSRALEENDEYFQIERSKLEQWADDQIHSAEQALHDTKTRIRDAKRRARSAETVQEQTGLQKQIKQLEQVQRRQRQQIFDVEDAIEAKRDDLIAALERRLNQRSHAVKLFRIRWRLV